MTDVYIAGVSMTAFGKHLDRSLKSLAGGALEGVLKDAGCEAKMIEAVFFGNCVQGHMEGQDMVRGEIALRPYGIEGVPVVNVENACATATTAFHMAVNYVKAGAADIALAIGVEKMFSEDKARMFSAFDGAWDVHEVEASKASFADMAKGVEVPPGSTSPRPYSVFMDIYAGFCRMHMREFGTTQEQLAVIASKNHQHSTMNPLSQFQRPFTVDEVMSAAPITYPLTLPMCSPISDGAAAAIVCSPAGLKRLKAAQARNINVLATILQSGSNRGITEFQKHASKLAAQKAYEKAGVGPADRTGRSGVADCPGGIRAFTFASVSLPLNPRVVMDWPLPYPCFLSGRIAAIRSVVHPLRAGWRHPKKGRPEAALQVPSSGPVGPTAIF